MTTLLEVRDLAASFFLDEGELKAVDGPGRQEADAEAVRWLGEMGIPEPEGRAKAYPHELRAACRRFQVVFQDPYRSLSPRMQIQSLIAEPLRLHRIVPEDKIEERVLELLRLVGLEPYFMHRYPHEMSGGQRQRVAIARAMAMEPDFLVAYVSALDVSVQAQMLNVLSELQRRVGIAMLFITHDLADRIAVMYQGKIVEQGATEQVIEHPQHVYTRRLLAAARGATCVVEAIVESIGEDHRLPSSNRRPAGTRCRGGAPVSR